jgi:hypothetical protein
VRLPAVLEWVDLALLIDGVPISTTDNPSDAFCGHPYYSTNSLTVLAPALPAGAHTIEILARDTLGPGGWIEDHALTVLEIQN